MIVRFWKEKRLSKMYSEILEDDEVTETEAKVDTTKTMEDEHKVIQQERETVRMKDTMEKIEVKSDKEVKSEPEKFQTTCCSIL